MPDALSTTPAGKPRARALGIPFTGTPGPANAITDVPGVEVGYVTLVEGSGPLQVGDGPVRTGVTAILPRGRQGVGTACAAGWHSLNGKGRSRPRSGEHCARRERPNAWTRTHSSTMSTLPP